MVLTFPLPFNIMSTLWNQPSARTIKRSVSTITRFLIIQFLLRSMLKSACSKALRAAASQDNLCERSVYPFSYWELVLRNILNVSRHNIRRLLRRTARLRLVPMYCLQPILQRHGKGKDLLPVQLTKWRQEWNNTSFRDGKMIDLADLVATNVFGKCSTRACSHF